MFYTVIQLAMVTVAERYPVFVTLDMHTVTLMFGLLFQVSGVVSLIVPVLSVLLETS